MPFKKNYKKTPLAKVGAKVIAKRALRLAHKLDNQSELKESIGSMNFTPTSTGLVEPLWALISGKEFNERVGNSINCKYLEVRAKVIMNAAITAQTQRLRVVIFRDLKQVASTSPQTVDLFGTTTPIDNALFSFKYVPSRFHVYYDREFRVTFMPSSYSNPNDEYANVTVKIPLHNLKMTWGASTSASILANGLYCYTQGGITEGVNSPTLLGEARIVFSDN